MGQSLSSPDGSTCLCMLASGSLSLVWLSLIGGHCTGIEDSCSHSRLSPTGQCPATLASQHLLHIPEPCTKRLPGAGIAFPFLHLPVSGKTWSKCDLGIFQGCHRVLAHPFLLFLTTANMLSHAKSREPVQKVQEKIRDLKEIMQLARCRS